MILTEAEAKTKWCPFARFLGQGAQGGRLIALAAVNIGDENGKEIRSYCISSRCMAWRWAQKPNPDYKRPHAQMPYPDNLPPTHIEDRERGFCGLAGRP